eukprot:CAMPEP_0197601758 /NCGR_PEP_ID=MMETSP1326-20131121/35892_1 /TAXON_ID=1155430 /ORGANISM="Genus nov. species nov., Strain RCC2288" /LENGTH=38 /DNA_ID= /DNA_START= /DNA_END= /DNA_ORIENTATION=
MTDQVQAAMWMVRTGATAARCRPTPSRHLARGSRPKRS